MLTPAGGTLAGVRGRPVVEGSRRITRGLCIGESGTPFNSVQFVPHRQKIPRKKEFALCWNRSQPLETAGNGSKEPPESALCFVLGVAPRGVMIRHAVRCAAHRIQPMPWAHRARREIET
ncbi:hypothetical protein LFL96_17800 [Paraburkholderia sp. D15]|uniref:hypothetical protein n=1 Tax=Paraburkholderia sp. D15 TaxID=2880218 RepID=UPI00247ADE75|nr:hypothetical protein [Paraburkholderia sp. D15]WGS49585.1 hypothetical protein LFL96_17800 [Paraburkholderia sp. D15]